MLHFLCVWVLHSCGQTQSRPADSAEVVALLKGLEIRLYSLLCLTYTPLSYSASNTNNSLPSTTSLLASPL